MGSQASIAQSSSAVTAQNSGALNSQPSDPVDTAVSEIKDKLSTDVWSGDFAVSHGDVKIIANTLEGLDGAQAGEVIDRLKQDGTLNTMADQMMDGSVINGGLSSSELTDFFNNMASKLDGASLSSLSGAFAQTDSNSGGIDAVEKLGQAVAAQSSDSVKLEYIQELAALSTDKPEYNTRPFLSGSTYSHTGDAEALAIGHVLSSLDANPSMAEQAFSSLSSEQLKAVMSASVDETVVYSGSSVSVSFNAELAEGILGSASEISNADLKAHIFDAGADVLEHINNDFGFPVVSVGKSAAADMIANRLADIIDSDTTGVVRELAYNSNTFDGTEIAVYAKQMLNMGNEEQLGEQLGRLQFGNNLSESPITRLETSVTLSTGAVRYENSGALGHFVGGVYSAAESISSDVKQQQALVTSVLKSVLSIVDKAKISGPVSVGAAVGKEWVSHAVNAAINDPGTSAAEQLERAAIPINPSTNEVGIGDNAMSAFNDRISQIQRLANP